MLKEGTVPYGMLIFREALAQYGLQVISYCICNKLPLFVREPNGDLKYITESDLYDYLAKVVNLEML